MQAPYPEPERLQGDVVLSAPDDGHGSMYEGGLDLGEPGSGPYRVAF